MMQLRLARYYASGEDLADYSPEPTDEFVYLLNIVVANVADNYSETFDAFVSTPKWLLVQVEREEVLSGRHRIIVPRHDLPRLVSFLEGFIGDIHVTDWAEAISVMDQLAGWEDEPRYDPGHHMSYGSLMQLRLVRYYGSGIEDLADYRPEPADEFAYRLNIEVSPVGDTYFDTFSALVCTPKWLLKRLEREEVLSGRHHIIVRRHDLPRLVSFFEGFLAGIHVADWSEAISVMDRLARWEDQAGRVSASRGAD